MCFWQPGHVTAAGGSAKLASGARSGIVALQASHRAAESMVRSTTETGGPFPRRPGRTTLHPFEGVGELGTDDARRTDDAAANAAMNRYARGDDAAFAELYDRMGHRVHSFVLRRVGDRSAA